MDDEDQLRHDGENAAIIEQAKGVLMGAQDIDADAAFAMLVQASQRENRKLHAIAAEIVGSCGRGVRIPPGPH